MATFVLVHGSFHGGWCWDGVAERLRAAGHAVFAPTLTGLGERSHLLSPEVDLDTHIADIAGVIAWQDLHDIVLVGHSYGGMVTTGVCDRLSDRIAVHVCLDALVPSDGDTVMGLLQPGTVAAFQVFAQPFVMTQGGPGDASRFLVLYVYETAFRHLDMGYAATVSWVLFLVLAALAAVFVKTSPRWVHYAARSRG